MLEVVVSEQGTPRGGTRVEGTFQFQAVPRVGEWLDFRGRVEGHTVLEVTHVGWMQDDDHVFVPVIKARRVS